MKQQKKRRKNRDALVLQLLIIVALVLVVFEGRLIFTMLTFRSSAPAATVSDGSGETVSSDSADEETEETGSGSELSSLPSSHTAPLAGFPGLGNSFGGGSAPETEAAVHATVSNPDSPAIVPEREPSVDDSYFSDAVFIGDSRMEGFRNVSGITQGTFFTSVGMSLSSMATGEVISTSDGMITVAAALSGGSYSKIYIMLGTNDLGEYNWDSFRSGFISVTQRFREIQPDAMIYICSVIYVEESKVASSEYVNNTNVDTINSILLEICEEQGYHYLDLNEILSNGQGSLIEGASSDGVHIYETYCRQMLDYLKSHYVLPDTSTDEPESETGEASDSVSS